MKTPLTQRRFFMEGLLLAVTIFWGISYLWCKDIAATGVDTNAYVAIRYGLAVLLMLPIFWKDLRQITREDLKHGIILGVLYYGAQTTQVWGMHYTTPANGSFITAAYVVLVPVSSWLLMKQKLEKRLIPSILLCLVGLYILNFSAGEGLEINLGNLITLGCAIIWSIQVAYLSYAGRTVKTSILTIVPMMVSAVIAGAAALVTGGFHMENVAMGPFFKTVILLVLFPTILSGLGQTYAQKYIAPNKAAVIYTLESAIACVLAVLWGYDQPSARLFVGGGLIMGAIILMDVRWPRRKHKEDLSNESC